MKIAEKVEEISPTRFGLNILWTLNFKAMPYALLWAVSLFASIQTKSTFLRFFAVLLCGIAAILEGSLIRNSLSPRAKVSLVSAFGDKVLIIVLTISGIAFAITLENVARYSGSSRIIRLLMVSNFITMLVIWLFVQVVFTPIRFVVSPKPSGRESFRLSLNYIAGERKSLAISIFSLLLGWPLFFFYFLLALTFAQAMTFARAMTFSSMQISERSPIGK